MERIGSSEVKAPDAMPIPHPSPPPSPPADAPKCVGAAEWSESFGPE